MPELTFEQVREAAKEVVAGKEDFVYNSNNNPCFYVPAGDPRLRAAYLENPEGTSNPAWVPDGDPRQSTGCLIGEMLTRLGLMSDSIAGSSSPINVLVNAGTVEATPKARAFMRFLQSRQDGGSTWGQAFAFAEREVQDV